MVEGQPGGVRGQELVQNPTNHSPALPSSESYDECDYDIYINDISFSLYYFFLLLDEHRALLVSDSCQSQNVSSGALFLCFTNEAVCALCALSLFFFAQEEQPSERG